MLRNVFSQYFIAIVIIFASLRTASLPIQAGTHTKKELNNRPQEGKKEMYLKSLKTCGVFCITDLFTLCSLKGEEFRT